MCVDTDTDTGAVGKREREETKRDKERKVGGVEKRKKPVGNWVLGYLGLAPKKGRRLPPERSGHQPQLGWLILSLTNHNPEQV